MAAADYADRVTDILAFETSAQGKELSSRGTLFGTEAGFLCTGIQKLAQRFLLELLTESGSIVHQKERGCDFLKNLRSGNVRTELDVFQIFSLGRPVVASNLRGEEDGSEPNDERYAGSYLSNVIIAQDSLTLTIAVQSRQGTTREIILPLAM